jgi:hypothetical protein
VSRNKPINVKVSTAKVVKALEEALASRKKSMTDAEKAKAQYEKDKKAFLDEIAKMFREGKGKAVKVNEAYQYRRHADENTTELFEITVEMPKSVKMPKEPEVDTSHWGVKSEIEELENAIKILKLTDEEYVSTNTYNGVARYI